MTEEQDYYEQLAAEVLPCIAYDCGTEHYLACPAYRRAAVVTALRAAATMGYTRGTQDAVVGLKELATDGLEKR
jgi:hypothetical protein